MRNILKIHIRAIFIVFYITLFIACTKKEVPAVVEPISYEKPKSLTYDIVLGEGLSNHGGLRIQGPDTEIYFHDIFKRDDIKHILPYQKNIIVIYLDGKVESIALESFQTLWEIYLPYGSYLNPYIKDDKLVIITREGHIRVIEADNGDIYVNHNYNNGFWYDPIVLNRRIYTVTNNGDLAVFSNEIGAKEVPLDLNLEGDWILLDGSIYVFDNSDTLLKVDPYSFKAEPVLEGSKIELSRLSGGLGYLIIQNCDLLLYNLEPLNMIKKVSASTLFSPSASIHSGHFVNITRKGRVSLHSLGVEEAIWDVDIPENVEFKPLISSEAVYIVGKKGLYIIDRDNGELLSSYTADDDIINIPIVLQDYILLPTSKGIVKLGRDKPYSYREPWKVIHEELEVGHDEYYSLPEEGLYFKFSPKESGLYSFISDTMESYPVEINILNSLGNSIYYNVGYVAFERKFTNEFFKGEDYYIHCKPINSDGGEFHLKLK